MVASLTCLLTAAPLVAACSDSSAAPAVPCNEDPWECGAGHTCWPVSTTAFDCLVSGMGKAGDACQNVTNSPACTDGMACLEPGPAGGVCVPYCDATHTCPAGTTCTMGALDGTTPFQVCLGAPAPALDAGAD
jgi:hypothetical protein